MRKTNQISNYGKIAEKAEDYSVSAEKKTQTPLQTYTKKQTGQH